MALGWKSYGLLQQIHRKLCFPKPMETALDPSREFRRDGPVPRSGRPHDTSILSNTISRALRTYELRLMLQKHGWLCVAKECGIFPLSRMVQWSQRNQDVGVKTCLPGFTLSIGVKCGAEKSCEVFRHEVALCLLKCQKHRVLQKRCSSRAMSHTHATQNTSLVHSRRLNHFFGWWSHQQCFNMFRIRSVVEDATSASSLAGAVINWDRKASRKTWLEGVAGRRGRRTCSWFRASSPESCSPVVCKKPELQDASQFTESIGCLEEVSRFHTQAISCCCCVAKDMGLSLSSA